MADNIFRTTRAKFSSPDSFVDAKSAIEKEGEGGSVIECSIHLQIQPNIEDQNEVWRDKRDQNDSISIKQSESNEESETRDLCEICGEIIKATDSRHEASYGHFL